MLLSRNHTGIELTDKVPEGDTMRYKNRRRILTYIIICILTAAGSVNAFAYSGSMGYDGGISAADPYENNTYLYREVCFLTGVPVIFEGTLTVKKNVRKDRINTTYTYNLQNVELDATITRVAVIDTYTETKQTGQKVESSTHARMPTEIVRFGQTTYSLTGYRFTQSGITDPKPAVYYNAGEYSVKKTYRISTGGTIELEMTGNQYGYDQYWSSAKAGRVNIMISAKPEIGGETAPWGGWAEVSVSCTAKKDFKYIKNEPWQISFEGGYVEQNWEESILEYNAMLPEFDKNGRATEVMRSYSERMGINTEPVNTRLMVPDLKHLEGHWAEEPVKILYSLEILPGTGDNFNPAKYVTRRDFTAMVVRAVKDIPEDPDLVVRTVTTPSRSRSNTPEISPFLDVGTDDPNYEEIKIASSRGIIQGTGQAYFSPDRHITKAEAFTILIRAIGLEGLASYPYSITHFADNDSIPAFARNAAAVAYRIGLAEEDSRGNFNPDEKLTYEKASDIMYRFIQYLGKELVKDYRERILNY